MWMTPACAAICSASLGTQKQRAEKAYFARPESWSGSMGGGRPPRDQRGHLEGGEKASFDADTWPPPPFASAS